MSDAEAASTETATPTNLGFGVDVGGSGIKGGIVDLDSGELVGERFKVLTPQPSTPEAVAGGVAEVVEHFGWTGPVGITLPGVVTDGIMRTAANIDKGWIDTDVYELFSSHLGGRQVSVLNDADAAGMAEDRYGAAADVDGVVMLLTLGTGIGSAILIDGTLVPNTELGHMIVDGKEAEHRASSKVKEDKGWSYEKWAGKVSKVLEAYEVLFWPKVFVIGGGISRKSDKWVPFLTNSTPVVPATLKNTAGIVGAAMAVTAGLRA
ncbi:ROK family protein [Gordonia sp. Z-3]|jgi:polyphosphate glucokinase|uniref:ROK family protein n=2 Tax=Gordonia TaxID=2053 RepID=A0A9X3D5W9_9ACTN|nr:MULTISPECIES: ROK family protein [Gordonia]MAU82852.1 polyphosphate glucokinase [Gordonia sp. (in: high G+C Gram-positive bacteria)]MCF3937540.1 ROK family protein [Gordonia tangerina]MCX2965481.1 ROK family protein [Gordonia aquimaris]MED5800230.1 ROK family protein [Gordonia sp. Z-3]